LEIKTHKPRILLVGHSAGEPIFGAERGLLQLSAAVDPTRYHVSCALPGARRGYLRALERHVSEISVFPYEWRRPGDTPDDKAVARFEDLLKRKKIDLVHVNSLTLMSPIWAASKFGARVIVHARELLHDDKPLSRRLGRTAEKGLQDVKSCCDLAIANSETTLRAINWPGRSIHLYNPVDTQELGRVKSNQRSALRVAMIGSQIPQKGISALIRLSRLAESALPDVEFFSIGARNRNVARWEAFIRSAEGASQNLRFLDYVRDQRRLYGLTDVVVSLTKVAESFGRTIAEAMAAGRPVIAFSHGAMPELIRHGRDGFLVPPGDLDGVLESIAVLQKNPELRRQMGAAGRERACRLFSQASFAKKLNHIYEDVLSR
jgi:glycosyltransferase involved in cell wall biosynthesis